MRKENSRECPICEARLQGTRLSGYTCAKCKAHFTARFAARVRRAEFTALVHKHFGKRESFERIEREHFVFPVNARVEQALEEAKLAAQQSRHHLEELLEVTTETE
jgi:hypothetical protein